CNTIKNDNPDNLRITIRQNLRTCILPCRPEMADYTINASHLWYNKKQTRTKTTDGLQQWMGYRGQKHDTMHKKRNRFWDIHSA
ncbi:MAG: hypothetical protein LBQ21_05165, partial [Clostridiales Family XIII bacterium]|nr:hypothetical protein [Clostridiales Family XIII bacterium]